jgi:hypothetical protein
LNCLCTANKSNRVFLGLLNSLKRDVSSPGVHTKSAFLLQINSMKSPLMRCHNIVVGALHLISTGDPSRIWTRGTASAPLLPSLSRFFLREISRRNGCGVLRVMVIEIGCQHVAAFQMHRLLPVFGPCMKVETRVSRARLVWINGPPPSEELNAVSGNPWA